MPFSAVYCRYTHTALCGLAPASRTLKQFGEVRLRDPWGDKSLSMHSAAGKAKSTAWMKDRDSWPELAACPPAPSISSAAVVCQCQCRCILDDSYRYPVPPVTSASVFPGSNARCLPIFKKPVLMGVVGRTWCPWRDEETGFWRYRHAVV